MAKFSSERFILLHFFYLTPRDVTSSVQKYIIVISHLQSASKINSMLYVVGGLTGGVGTDPSSDKSAESDAANGTTGILTNLRVSFLMLIRAFKVFVGSLLCGAGYGN